MRRTIVTLLMDPQRTQPGPACRTQPGPWRSGQLAQRATRCKGVKAVRYTASVKHNAGVRFGGKESQFRPHAGPSACNMVLEPLGDTYTPSAWARLLPGKAAPKGRKRFIALWAYIAVRLALGASVAFSWQSQGRPEPSIATAAATCTTPLAPHQTCRQGAIPRSAVTRTPRVHHGIRDPPSPLPPPRPLLGAGPSGRLSNASDTVGAGPTAPAFEHQQHLHTPPGAGEGTPSRPGSGVRPLRSAASICRYQLLYPFHRRRPLTRCV